MIRNVVFDLDGTLTDPRTGITRCIRFALERLGRKAPRDEDLLWCIGPPIRDSFAELLGTGHRLFVATSKLTVFARPILVHFGLDHWFEEVRGSELDGTNNAKANLLRGLLEARSLDPAETVMIGDRRCDIEGVRANAIAAIAVTYGYGTEEELSAAQPDAICAEPADIPAAIGALAS